MTDQSSDTRVLDHANTQLLIKAYEAAGNTAKFYGKADGVPAVLVVDCKNTKNDTVIIADQLNAPDQYVQNFRPGEDRIELWMTNGNEDFTRGHFQSNAAFGAVISIASANWIEIDPEFYRSTLEQFKGVKWKAESHLLDQVTQSIDKINLDELFGVTPKTIPAVRGPGPVMTPEPVAVQQPEPVVPPEERDYEAELLGFF
ncbi:hypothetical protein FHS85_003776 [Rhodoligotrophos appendicifer]|uniref:hypothetical protein n=1 Tax=Rhodoligotrophos appendicifer TaxID=987056 RepID=UPI001185152A|nr:hypothetical protein [Rhodoligotrophos appendicifer]